jgi:hypothetical protein
VSDRRQGWVVEFAGCQEAVIRTGGSLEEVNQPDNLGCPVLRIRPLLEVELRGGLWEKDGELRCELV